MFCKNCGKEIFDEAVFCPHCGTAVNKAIETDNKRSEDTNSLGVTFIISGAINIVLSIVFACLPNNYIYSGIVSSYGSISEIRLMESLFVISNIHTALAVISFILLVLGVVFCIIKKPQATKKTRKMITILTTVGLFVLNVVLIIPFIVYQVKY